jgi:hypothetical protein
MTANCCEPIFFKKVDKTFFRKWKIGHFENVQKKYFENTFATKFCKNAKIPSFYYQNLYNLIFFLQESLILVGPFFQQKPVKSDFCGHP